MTRSHRKERLNESIKEILSELLLTGIKDPRIGLVTITSVKIAPDLLTAKVYFSVMGSSDEKAETRKGLESAKSFMRKTVFRELKLRQVPEFKFVYDDSLDKAMAIEEALKEIKDQDKGKA
ncbi:MAG: 30S ribosome-binding factor RbfA [Candidatus Latescibacteria bacterium]|nr:30S ribosome-binding factor RbfA [Candidatus Latescibacterota bacterium]NIO27329.1 30S ribosome-binding factor RbfA [Candidatus Latescibacterota bacterium]NIO54853.1 30S ribosome-binding factor RbfA [Candidatus Latescibacterota bacterium]NIT00936.1 30S ribosome-binding factor RbfA [Candidatus Latescibacterota bacterium]NIT37859.1 30S ribosome-binding factor RbfA [Candidatus Latescibacterota bacterium]